MKVSKVSVIIVTYNSEDCIINCLRSIQKESTIKEVIVVDNASQDRTVKVIRHQFSQWRNLILIENIGNVGFAKACNQGSTLATADYILFLNPDTIVSPGAIRTLSQFLDKNPDVGIVGPRILYQNGKLQLSCGRKPSLFWSILNSFSLYKLSPYIFARDRYGHLKHDQIREVDWISGACLMIRRQLYLEVKGFDENFFFTEEDVDLCYRVKSRGYKVIYHPLTTIIHLKGQSARKVKPMIILKSYQSKLYFYHKHYGKASASVLRVVFSISSISKALFSLLAIICGFSKYKDIFKAHSQAAFKVWKIPIPEPKN